MIYQAVATLSAENLRFHDAEVEAALFKPCVGRKASLLLQILLHFLVPRGCWAFTLSGKTYRSAYGADYC